MEHGHHQHRSIPAEWDHDEGGIVELFRLDPEIFAGLIAVSLRVDDDRIDQLEDVLQMCIRDR